MSVSPCSFDYLGTGPHGNLRVRFPALPAIQLFLWLKREVKGAISGAEDLLNKPIQNRYTTGSGKAWLARSGFTVSSVLHSRK